jgi:hypothetical protein
VHPENGSEFRNANKGFGFEKILHRASDTENANIISVIKIGTKRKRKHNFQKTWNK